MSMRYDAQSHSLVLTAADGEGAVLPVLLVNQCTCGAILRVYVELPNPSGLSLEKYLDWREAARYEARKQGKYLILFPPAYQDERARCCRREKYLAFGLEPAIARWLQRRGIATEPGVVSRVRDVLLAREVPGLALLREGITGEVMGLSWHEKAVYGGDRYWSGWLCAACYEAVYGSDTACRACGSKDLIAVQPESWEQFDTRRKRGWAELASILGLPELANQAR